jgi:transposase
MGWVSAIVSCTWYPNILPISRWSTGTGEGISADLLHDDCLGRTLDWIARQARERFGLAATRVHVDTTSFSVSGAYEADPEAADAAQIAITYGYSRDHREDLKQWMLALVTTHDGDVPLFMRPLDGNSSDKTSISAVVTQVIEQLRESSPTGQEEPFVVFDSGGYSQANMKAYNEAKVRWCSRVPETSAQAKAALAEEPEQWQELSDR